VSKPHASRHAADVTVMPAGEPFERARACGHLEAGALQEPRSSPADGIAHSVLDLLDVFPLFVGWELTLRVNRE